MTDFSSGKSTSQGSWLKIKIMALQPAYKNVSNPVSAQIQLREVVKVYRSAAGDFQALNGINLDIYRGEFLGVIGKSGAGKSTLLNMITGVDGLTTGEVQIEGVNVHQISENQRAKWRGRTLGVIYQSFQLLPMLTLIDNVVLPIDFRQRLPAAFEP